MTKQINEIMKALICVRRKIKQPEKNSQGQYPKHKYANLAEVLSVIDEAIKDEPITFSQHPQKKEDGPWTLTTAIYHENGESIYWHMPLLGKFLQTNDPQHLGSALTYCRRYALACIFGLYQEDTDAKEDNEAAIATNGKVTQFQIKDLKAMMESLTIDKHENFFKLYKIIKVEDLPVTKYNEAKKFLLSLLRKNEDTSYE